MVLSVGVSISDAVAWEKTWNGGCRVEPSDKIKFAQTPQYFNRQNRTSHERKKHPKCALSANRPGKLVCGVETHGRVFDGNKGHQKKKMQAIIKCRKDLKCKKKFV
jgi:hypothetical protein